MTEIHPISSRTAATWGFVVAIAATLSTLIQITFDEAIWVWAGREIFAGGIPYREVVDHKTVLVFGLEALLDLAPGAFEVARGLGVGLTIAAIGVMGSALFRRVGGEHRFALRIGLLSAVVAFLQTRLVSTVELWAAAALLGALLLLANRKYRLAAAVTCLGAMIDIRAIAFVPVVSLFAAEQGGRSALRKYITILAPLLLITTAVVLAFPDVRFGVIELAAASRSSQFYPFDQAMVGVRALILPAVLVPIVVGVNPGSIRSAFRRSGTLFLVTAIAIAVISRLPFARYWLFVVPAIPVIARQLQSPVARPTRDGGPTRAMIAGLVTFALLPGIFRIVNETLVVDREPLERYEPVVSELAQSLAAGQSFIHYPDKPYLPSFLPDRYVAPSVVMHYYVRETNRKELALSQLQASIDAAVVVIDEGQLSLQQQEIPAQERKVWEIFQAKISEFPCLQMIGTITLHWRGTSCPIGQGT